MKKIILFLIILISSFMFINTQAEEYYYINGTYVRMRSTPSSSGSKVLEFPKDAIISLLSREVYVGSGCDAGWYHVSYNGQTGYVCKEYVSVRNSLSSYGRPWNTPKKSIVGGAEYIYKNYIASGQYNSYLKKFNVNPNSSSPFAHQYMTNLQAPASEASISYSSYTNNGLMDLPLVFEIPIFNNMPASTYNASIKNTGIEEMWNIEDYDFENYLNGQGFPDTYKTKLRVLHKRHPNWVFKSLNTTYDFAYAAERQRTVGAMPNNSGQCWGDANSVESGWCIPSYDAAAFFMDPRNFLIEKYILQFESLNYSDNQTEAVVQSILNNTAMAGISALDNQSFASIFVEAGKTNNVSPVYLASLARQESGNGTGFGARGEPFDYNGIHYDGNLYNYFNIGASSSESNPVLAGLVFASGGVTSNAGGTSSSGSSNSGGTSSDSYVGMLGGVSSGSFLKGYETGTTAGGIKAKVNGQANVVITDANGQVLGDGAVIGTGARITISDGSSTYTYTLVIKGDLNGDGNINSADLLRVRQYLIGSTSLNDSFKEAADVNKDGVLNSADLLRVRQQLLGTFKIVQG